MRLRTVGAPADARPRVLYLPRGISQAALPTLSPDGEILTPRDEEAAADLWLQPNPNRVGIPDHVPTGRVKDAGKRPKVDFTPNPFRRHTRGRRGAAHRDEKPDRHAERAQGKERDLRKDLASRTKSFELRGLRGYAGSSLADKKAEAHAARVRRGESALPKADYLTRTAMGLGPSARRPARRDAPKAKTRKAPIAAAAAAVTTASVAEDAKAFNRTGRLPRFTDSSADEIAGYQDLLDKAVAEGRISRKLAKRMIEKLRLVGVELNPGPQMKYTLSDVYCPIGRPIRGQYFPLSARGIRKQHREGGTLPWRYYRLKSRVDIRVSIDPLAVEGDEHGAAYYCNYVEAKWESGPYDEAIRTVMKVIFTSERMPEDRLPRRFSVVAMLLLMAGIEPNPGPRGEVPQSSAQAGKTEGAERIRQKATFKARDRAPPKAKPEKVVKTGGVGAMKSAKEKVVALVESQAADLKAKQQAVVDVEAQVDAAAKAEEARLLKVRRQDELAKVQEDLDKLVGTAFHNVVPRQAFTSWCEVQPKRSLLSRFPIPFRVTEVVELQAAYHCDLDDMRSLVAQTPADKRLFKPTEPHIIVRATARTYCYAWGFQQVSEDGLYFSCTFSWDQFCDFRSSRCDEYRFDNVLSRVISFRRAGRTNPQDSRRYTTADLMADNVFAALHIVTTPNNDQAGAILVDMAVKGCTSVLERKMVKAAAGRLAPGVYVRGYEVGFDEMFPDEWKEAVEATASGVKTAKAALRAFFSAVAKTGCEVAESAREGLELRLARGREKAARYCRMHGLHIEGLFPAFPDPYDFGNILVSGCKRLLRRVDEPTVEAQRYEAAAAAALVEEAANFPADFAPSTVDLKTQALDYCFSKHFNKDQEDEFVQGVFLTHSVRNKSMTLSEFIEVVQPEIEKMKAFIKAEDYQKDAVKADRFIVCPCHLLRGVLWEAYRRPCEGFFAMLGAHCVKHRTPEENLEITLNMFAAVQDGDNTHLKTDGKNFESLIGKFRRTLEQEVIRAFAHEEDRALLKCLDKLLMGDFSITTEFITMVLSTIRRSGEYVTSCGNAICNHNMTFGMLAWAHRIPVAEVKEWVRRYKSLNGWRFEGDDGIVVVQRSVLDRFREAFAHFGVAMSMATSELPTGFLKQELVQCAGRVQIYRNPIDLLASLTAWIKCDGTTLKHDTDMLLARAASYFYLYRRIPLIAEACWAILRRYAKRFRELTYAAALGSTKPAAAKLREFWARVEGVDYGAPGQRIAEWFNTHTFATRLWDRAAGRLYLAPDIAITDAPPELEPDMLAHCCVELGCSVADLAAMGERITSYFSTADDSPLAEGLHLPEIREWMARQSAMARMSIEKVEDVRVRALTRAREAYAVAGAAATANITRMVTWTVHMFMLLGTVVAGFQMRSLFVMFGWSSVPLYPILMVLFFPLFMMAVGVPVYFFLHWGLQLPKAVSRGVVSGAMWTVLFVEVAAAVRVYQLGSDGLAGLIGVAGSAPTTAWAAATGLLANAARGVLRRVI